MRPEHIYLFVNGEGAQTKSCGVLKT